MIEFGVVSTDVPFKIEEIEALKSKITRKRGAVLQNNASTAKTLWVFVT